MSWLAKFAVSLIVGLAEALVPTIHGWLRGRQAAKQLEDDRKAIRDAVARAQEGKPDAPH